MSAKALEYAENNLGVHTVYTDAQAVLAELDEVTGDLDKAQDLRRKLVEEIADREADLLIDERGKHADQSATWMGEHMKIVKRKDTFLIELRSKLNDALGTIQGCEYDSDLMKMKLRLATARMNELGGYFNYLAVVKAETANKANKTTEGSA